MEPGAVRVVFPLERDEDGYPPFREEGIWVEVLAAGVGKVLNIPFFVWGIGRGDLIAFATPEQGDAEFVELLSPRGSSTLRLLFEDVSAVGAVVDRLVALGCDGEPGPIEGLVAVAVPAGSDLGVVIALLAEWRAAGILEFESACVGQPLPES